jgi:tRNA(adenine34) deaminase
MNDLFYMQKALELAQIAWDEGEIPVGALVVCKNKIIGRGYNQTQKLNDVTAHAEMIAITSASYFLGAKYLSDCTLYVTLEPCVMCAGAIAWAQTGRLVYGASDEKKGFSLLNQPVLHPKTQVLAGVLAEEAEEMLKSFFQKLRK